MPFLIINPNVRAIYATYNISIQLLSWFSSFAALMECFNVDEDEEVQGLSFTIGDDSPQSGSSRDLDTVFEEEQIAPQSPSAIKVHCYTNFCVCSNVCWVCTCVHACVRVYVCVCVRACMCMSQHSQVARASAC